MKVEPLDDNLYSWKCSIKAFVSPTHAYRAFGRLTSCMYSPIAHTRTEYFISSWNYLRTSRSKRPQYVLILLPL